ncbi:hypothetical protein [uncultured Algimonas sp.]|uniref:hypothetical protein n=1 Tax=uncultured Algimonas sp. TaxID=1547920 RepID=UPI0026193134|nr:hypothetical protein [uncultured Algimonas sp.]
MDRKLTFIVYGIIVWLIGVALIRFLHPIAYPNLALHLLMLAVAVLAAPPTLIAIARLTGRTRHDMLVPMAIMAMPSMMMDGLAITFDAMGVSHIYAETPLYSAYSGGVLLVAFWALFLFSLLWHRKAV